MNQFYVSLVFLGIILIFFSLIWVLLDKKKTFGFIKGFDEKKQELVTIINDAEQMIEELNKFSDYIVTQMDLKNEELRANFKKADDEIKHLSQRAQEVCCAMTEAVSEAKAEAKIEYKADKAVNGGSTDISARSQEQFFKYNSDLIIENMNFESTAEMKTPQAQRIPVKRTDKVIPINNRYRDVLQLSQNGMSEVDIAKRLNMGKGEIQLILELNK